MGDNKEERLKIIQNKCKNTSKCSVLGYFQLWNTVNTIMEVMNLFRYAGLENT